MNMNPTVWLLSALVPALAFGAGEESAAAPKELGAVCWKRDLDHTLKMGDKPIFLLFQEVPGCSTCVGFGETALSHPLVVEAIETMFHPVLVYNNRKGRDADLLKRFDEPAWNNPVVRFLNAKGSDLVPRKEGVWKTHELAERMAKALRAAHRPVPDYLDLTIEETDPSLLAKARFTMGCFWEGSANLGALKGVVSTQAVFVGRQEGVEIAYRPTLLSLEALMKHAEAASCRFSPTPAEGEANIKSAPASDQLFYLQQSRFARFPLTPLQRTRVNASLKLKEDPTRWMSPRQIAGTVTVWPPKD